MQHSRAAFPLVEVLGKLYALGGVANISDSGKPVGITGMEVYDPAENSWEVVGYLGGGTRPTLLGIELLATVRRSAIYVYGGLNRSGFNFSNNSMSYDTITKVWTQLTKPEPGLCKQGTLTSMHGFSSEKDYIWLVSHLGKQPIHQSYHVKEGVWSERSINVTTFEDENESRIQLEHLDYPCCTLLEHGSDSMVVMFGRRDGVVNIIQEGFGAREEDSSLEGWNNFVYATVKIPFRRFYASAIDLYHKQMKMNN